MCVFHIRPGVEHDSRCVTATVFPIETMRARSMQRKFVCLLRCWRRRSHPSIPLAFCHVWKMERGTGKSRREQRKPEYGTPGKCGNYKLNRQYWLAFANANKQKYYAEYAIMGLCWSRTRCLQKNVGRWVLAICPQMADATTYVLLKLTLSCHNQWPGYACM